MSDVFRRPANPAGRHPADGDATCTPTDATTTSPRPAPYPQRTSPAVSDNNEAVRVTDTPSAWHRLALFLVIFGVFAGLVVSLVALGQNLAVSVGVPAALGGAALAVLGQLVPSARHRE
ncbi:hypothetical protein [Amycolatopsis sp. NPDC054798]